MTSLALGIIGLSLGWLVGLSVSPVLGGVLTTILGVVVAVTAVVVGTAGSHGRLAALIGGDDAGEKESSQHKVSALPLMLLVLGVGLGATAGLAARVNGWLITEATHANASRNDGSFENSYATSKIGLYATQVNAEACNRMSSQLPYPNSLKTEMLSSGDPILRNVALNTASDSATMVAAVRLICVGRK